MKWQKYYEQSMPHVELEKHQHNANISPILFRGRGGRFLYIVPTIDLSAQIKSTLKRFGVHPNTIHNIHSHKTCPSVSNKIIQVAEDLIRERFGVLTIQLEALKILPYCPIKGDWEVIIDEVPPTHTIGLRCHITII